MTVIQKVNMFKEKAKFIQKLDLVLTTPKPAGMSIEGVEYEVYTKSPQAGTTWFQEWIVIEYTGGSILPVVVSGNSNSANFQVVADSLHGGDYSALPSYEKCKAEWDRVDLED